MMTQQGGYGAEEAYNKFNFDILTPFYQRIKAFVDENFNTKEEITKELESMKLVKQRLIVYGTEFEKATLNQYMWELENKLERVG